ncbi:MAG: hypothetical protein IPK85_03180 [Gemmatimonadetes bacterium]|nr:hypothetical protein [Gemmatimonadota bacterium]
MDVCVPLPAALAVLVVQALGHQIDRGSGVTGEAAHVDGPLQPGLAILHEHPPNDDAAAVLCHGSSPVAEGRAVGSPTSRPPLLIAANQLPSGQRLVSGLLQVGRAELLVATQVIEPNLDVPVDLLADHLSGVPLPTRASTHMRVADLGHVALLPSGELTG